MASNNGTPNASKGRLEMIKYGAFCLQFIHFPGRSRGQLEAILQEASFCVSSQPASATLWLAYYYAYSRWRVTHLDHLRQLEVRTVVYQYMHAVLRTHLDATRFVSCDAKSGVRRTPAVLMLCYTCTKNFVSSLQTSQTTIGSFDLRFIATTTEIGIFFSLSIFYFGLRF